MVWLSQSRRDRNRPLAYALTIEAETTGYVRIANDTGLPFGDFRREFRQKFLLLTF
jgi:hypothetical protein